MEKIKVVCIGAGKRFRTMYLPVLRQRAQHFNLVGFTTRTTEGGERISVIEHVPFFRTTQSLIEETKPDLIVICVSAEENARVLMEVLRWKCAVLCETPLAVRMGDARRIERLVHAARGCAVGVAEQKPFVPLEQWKRQLVHTGVLGTILVAHNDFYAYNYHAIAQLRACLGREIQPITANASRYRLPSAPGGNCEIWDVGTVSCTDNTILVHTFSDRYASIPFRPEPSFRCYGTRGSLVGSTLIYVSDDGITHRVVVECLRNDATLIAVYCTLADGRTIRWENPFADCSFTDDQIGVAMHLDTMRDTILGQGSPLYSVRDARMDVEIFEALKLSAYKGAVVRFPLHVTREMIRIGFSWGALRRIIAARYCRD